MSQKNILFYFKQPQSNTSESVDTNSNNESADTNSNNESVDTTATTSKPNTETLETSHKLEVFTDGSAINNGNKNVKGGMGIYYPDSSLSSNKAINCNQFIIDNPQYNITKATNNVAELLAILIAIRDLIPYVKHEPQLSNTPIIVIYSDSQYSINSVTKWAHGWKKAGWKKKSGKAKKALALAKPKALGLAKALAKPKNEIKNLEIIKEIYNYCEVYRIKFVHINSHMPEPPDKNSVEWKLWYGNDMADKLAQKAALS